MMVLVFLGSFMVFRQWDDLSLLSNMINFSSPTAEAHVLVVCKLCIFSNVVKLRIDSEQFQKKSPN